MVKRSNPIESWNKVIKGIKDAKSAWAEHLEVMQGRPNIEVLSIDAQTKLRYAFQRAPTFEKFLDAVIKYWKHHGGVEGMEILEKVEESEPKEEPKLKPRSKRL